MRIPFLIIGLILFALVLLIDLGSAYLPAAFDASSPPGIGFQALALLDGLFLMQVGQLGVSALLPGRVGRYLNGPGVLILSIFVILSGITMIFAAIGLLLLMISFLVAIPFGTIIYAALWGSFAKGTALGLLSLTVTLRIGGGICLVLYSFSMLKKTKLLVQFFTCIIAAVIASFLFGLVPGLLASIVDAIGAIITLILAIIWAIVLIGPGLTGTVRLVRALRA